MIELHPTLRSPSSPTIEGGIPRGENGDVHGAAVGLRHVEQNFVEGTEAPRRCVGAPEGLGPYLAMLGNWWREVSRWRSS